MQDYFSKKLFNTLRSYKLSAVFQVTGQSQEIVGQVIFMYRLNKSDINDWALESLIGWYCDLWMDTSELLIPYFGTGANHWLRIYYITTKEIKTLLSISPLIN